MTTVFIAGACTEIGKTYVTAAIVRRLRADGRDVRALKPVASGVPPMGDPDFSGSDTAQLLAAQGIAVTAAAVAACSPWRFAAPLAPDQAAALEGQAPVLEDIVTWCLERMEAATGTLIVEGVGGLMSPVTQEATGLGWLWSLACPAILISGSYLGAISHALTAYETCRAADIPVLAIVVNESTGAPTPPETVAEAIARHAEVPVIVIARDAPCPDALAALI
ncbi:dethiobiotin synthase [Methylobacterium sp. WL30]|uniref:dethiobiotin synthase n=1 Tax=unclassified Methylobacterium TaxID=2615210 RepID=UPI0011CB3922|nr:MULTISPECIES: dethiobiotin synthase [unclassified Methylobacterium]TXN36693.1 dethiobiotin synthase [Methylobacterium sp. WL93]TXN52837.1 dethiobiotin synthase [Methylobacterium sp. WL119]TXN70511.1 dethiobiotin synthase [Methylobacterium sp. WL30]